MFSKKIKILVSPLDWGIGHATRCVPLIRKLQSRDISVHLAGNGNSLEFLKKAFPGLPFSELPAYRISYPAKGSMALKMLISAPSFFRTMKKEHRFAEELIRQNNIDGLLSDNRFGFWSDKVPSVYITHQLMIKAPESLKFMEPRLYKMHKRIISRFSECWVPDLEGPFNLSGDLSHSYPLYDMIKFAGIMSRFSTPRLLSGEKPPDSPQVLAIISGPEPQRSLFEQIILQKLKEWPYDRAVVLTGNPERGTEPVITGKLTVYPHASDELIRDLIVNSDKIICRSGYSTVMDLASLGRSALLVPTPGQTEQEYLARHLSTKGWFGTCSQKQLSDMDFNQFSNYNLEDFSFPGGDELLDKRIDEFLKIL